MQRVMIKDKNISFDKYMSLLSSKLMRNILENLYIIYHFCHKTLSLCYKLIKPTF